MGRMREGAKVYGHGPILVLSLTTDGIIEQMRCGRNVWQE